MSEKVNKDQILEDIDSLRAQRDALEAKRGLLGRIGVKKQIAELDAQIQTGQRIIEEALSEHAQKALGLFRDLPRVDSYLLTEDEKTGKVQKPGAEELDSRFHSGEESPGVVAWETEHWLGAHGCGHCHNSVIDRSFKVIAFEDPADVNVTDNTEGLYDGPDVVAVSEPSGRVESLSISEQDLHDLQRHPQLPHTQEVADRVLGLEPYLNPPPNGNS